MRGGVVGPLAIAALLAAPAAGATEVYVVRCRPLGGGRRCSAFGSRVRLRGRDFFQSPPAADVWIVVVVTETVTGAAVQTSEHCLASLPGSQTLRDRNQQPPPAGMTRIAVGAVESGPCRYGLLELPSLGHARVGTVLISISALCSVDAAQHCFTGLLRTRVSGHRHRDVAPPRQLGVAKGTVGIGGAVTRRLRVSGLKGGNEQPSGNEQHPHHREHLPWSEPNPLMEPTQPPPNPRVQRTRAGRFAPCGSPLTRHPLGAL